PRTRSLLADLFEYQDLGLIEVKGFKRPVHPYRVIQPRSVESRFEALRTTTTPLVGRHEEIGVLMHRWEQIINRNGQVVLIAGEPGIGKSRLAAELLERLANAPHIRLRYFSSPQHTDSALFPIIGQMERAAGLAQDDTTETKLDKLDAVLAQTST